MIWEPSISLAEGCERVPLSPSRTVPMIMQGKPPPCCTGCADPHRGAHTLTGGHTFESTQTQTPQMLADLGSLPHTSQMYMLPLGQLLKSLLVPSCFLKGRCAPGLPCTGRTWAPAQRAMSTYLGLSAEPKPEGEALTVVTRAACGTDQPPAFSVLPWALCRLLPRLAYLPVRGHRLHPTAWLVWPWARC